MRVVLGLGSNLGDRWSHLAGAIEALRAVDAEAVVSPVYETAPVGGPEQGPYLNCVVVLQTAMPPEELLELAHRLEDGAGRVRRERFGPRTLDVDVLIVEGVVLDEEHLTLPHPRMNERAFVLAPLADVAPDLVAPDWVAALGGQKVIDASVRSVGAIVSPRRQPASE